MLIGRLRVARLALGLVLLAAVLAPLQIVVRQVAPDKRRTLPRLFHRGLLRLLRIRAATQGEPAPGGVLFVANHVSFADIPLLGSVLGASFVAKAEVSGWPLLGALARIDGVVFVDRARTRGAGGQAAALAERLAEGDGVVLFPEGTTGDGVTLLPFKSALFAAAEGSGDAIVQPVSLAYIRIGDRALDADERRALSWADDVSLVDHALKLLAGPKLTAGLIFHPRVRQSDFPDRKALARHCEEQVAQGIARLVAEA